MAVATGTALNHRDLLDKFITFVTGLASHPWTVLARDENPFHGNGDGEVYLNATGEDGEQDIYINIQIDTNANPSFAHWKMQGATAYDGGDAFDDQADAIPTAQGEPHMLLGTTSATYLFVANGNRAIISIAPDGAHDQNAYMGLIKPWGPVESYIYPLFIGGTSDAPGLYTASLSGMSWFCRDGHADTNTGVLSQAHVFEQGIGWHRLRMRIEGGDYDDHWDDISTEKRVHIWPWQWLDIAHKIAPVQDGSYMVVPSEVLIPINLDRHTNTEPVYHSMGILEGWYWTTGYGLTLADTITVSGGSVFVVVTDQDLAFANSYAAVELV